MPVYQQPTPLLRFLTTRRWPKVSEPIKKFSQPWIQLFLGHPVTGHAAETASEVNSREGGDSGSGNHMIFQRDVRWGLRVIDNWAGDKKAAERGVLSTFESQKEFGFMAPEGRDEGPSQSYQDYYIAHAAFCLRHGTPAMKEAAKDWLADWVALASRFLFDGEFYVPSPRGGTPGPSEMTKVVWDLLSGNEPRPKKGEKFFSVLNAGGTPENIGPWALREVIRGSELDLPLLANSKPPMLGRHVHVVKTREGDFLAWMTGLEISQPHDRLTPVAGLVNGKPFYVYGTIAAENKKTYPRITRFPDAQWPLSELDGKTVTSYEVNFPGGGWVDVMIQAKVPPADPPPTPRPSAKKKPWWKRLFGL